MPAIQTSAYAAKELETVSTISLSHWSDPQGLLFSTPSASEHTSVVPEAIQWLQAKWRMRLYHGLETLPYSDDFDAVYSEFSSEFGSLLPAFQKSTQASSMKSAFWLTLLKLRKNNLLSAAVRRIANTEIATVGRERETIRYEIDLPSTRRERERLPYTEQFDELFDRFHRRCRQLNITTTANRYVFWRTIVVIMKSDRVSQGPSLFDGIIERERRVLDPISK